MMLPSCAIPTAFGSGIIEKICIQDRHGALISREPPNPGRDGEVELHQNDERDARVGVHYA